MGDHTGQFATGYALKGLYSGFEGTPGSPQWDYAGYIPPGNPQGDIQEDTWNQTQPTHQVVYSGATQNELGDFWFEILHVFPRLIDIGILLTTQEYTLDVFNAFKNEPHDLETYLNNVGDGITITDLPTLPETLEPVSGFSLTLQASPQGPPTISGTLDFGFDLYDAYVVLTGLRVVLFPFRPQEPLNETLEFLTDIIQSVSGKEQRIALRKNPRQIFEMEILKQASQRQAIEIMMFDWQSRVFGLPVWVESMTLTSDASIGDTVIYVDSTENVDLRVDGLAAVLETYLKFDALQVESFTTTSITLTSGLTNDYDPGTEVYPVRRALAQETYQVNRHLRDLDSISLRWRIVDNDSDLADDTDWNTFDGKLILDGHNFVDGTVSQSFERQMLSMDNMTGAFSQTSQWENNKRYSVKTFVVDTREDLWKVRKLLHYLKGQQIAFYLPTSYQDIWPAENLESGSSTITLDSIGYSKFARERFPKINIRVHLVDGTTIDREIESASELDADTEQLTVDSSWPYQITPDQVDRIEFFELVRIAEDNIQLLHDNGWGTSTITLPVKAVFDE